VWYTESKNKLKKTSVEKFWNLYYRTRVMPCSCANTTIFGGICRHFSAALALRDTTLMHWILYICAIILMHCRRRCRTKILVGFPGFFNNPDFLTIDWPWLTLEEKKSHFALWSSFSAPLIITPLIIIADVSKISDDEIAYLTNKDIIAVDQDELALQATLVSSDETFDVLTKSLSNGDRLLTVFNKSNKTASD
jgi:hypothetical protein